MMFRIQLQTDLILLDFPDGIFQTRPVPTSVRSKARAGSNPAWGMDVSLLFSVLFCPV
jgi:hypothetical protein